MGGVRESLRPSERSEELQEAIETGEAIIEGAEQLVSHLGIFSAQCYPCNRRSAGQVVLHGRFAGGRSRLGGCPRVCGGVRGVFDGRLVAMRSW